MTSMLEKAFSEAAKLPDIEQNALAKWVLDEIESDKKWDALFAESEDTLAQLASEALEEEEHGKTTRNVTLIESCLQSMTQSIDRKSKAMTV